MKLEFDEIKRRREDEQQQIVTLTAALSEKTEGNLEKDYQIAKLKTAVHDSEEMIARLNKNCSGSGKKGFSSFDSKTLFLCSL